MPAGTVYVVDDHEAIRDSLALLLRSARFAVRSFASPSDFLADSRPRELDCLVLDVRMPRLSGIKVQERLIARGARIPVIFISGHGDIPMAVEAMRKGALDFLVKPFDDEALLGRVREAFDRILDGRRRRPERGVRLRGVAALSEREREVLARILDGDTNREVAKGLGVTSKAIEYHRARVMRKLGVRSAAELFRFCLDA